MQTQITPTTTPDLEKLQNKITLTCQAVRWLAIAWLVWILGLILMPFVDSAGWLEKINKSPALTSAPIQFQNLLASRGLNLVVWAIAALIGIAVWRLMTGYLQGNIFSQEAATRLKRVGQAGLLATIVSIAARPLSLWLLSPTLLSNMQTSAYIMPDDLLYLLICALILGLAHIYRTAAEINAENKGFI